MFFFTNNNFFYKIYGDSLQFVCNSCTSTSLLKWNKIIKTDKKNTSVMDDVPAFCKTCEVNSPYFIHHVNKGVLIVWCQSGSYVCHIISLSRSYVSYHMIIWNLCVIWYPYLEIMYHILFLSGSYMLYHMFIWKLCVKFCKAPQLCIWSACTKWREWMVMYMCLYHARRVNGHVYVC